MARASADILQLLANPTNRAILTVLATEPHYPRRLADVVGLTEDEASRRLRQFEKLGLAEAEWANLGKTVRLYRLASSSITVTVTGTGLSITGVADKEALEVGAVGESVPVLARFVGRARERRELAELLEQRAAACIHGIGGAGKTSLAAALASSRATPVAWHTLATGESGMLLLARLTSAVRGLVDKEAAQRLLALRAGEEAGQLIGAIAAALDASGALLVLDRFEGAGEGAGDVAAELARRLERGRLLVTSRVYPREFPREHIASYRLEGLAPEEAEELLAALSHAAPTPEAARLLHERTRGHPLSLVLVALASGRAPPDAALLAEESGIRDFLMGDVLPQLPETEREVLLTLSILRRPFTAEEAEAVCERRHARDALLRLESRGLVARAGAHFSLHDLVRSFAEDAAPEARKAHARAAKALLASEEPAKVLEAMHHFVRAGDAAGAAAIARDELLLRKYRFQDQGLSPLYREQLHALEATRALKPPEQVPVLLELALLDATRVALDEAERRLASAERALPRAQGAYRAPLAIVRARILHGRGRTAEAGAAYAEAARLAEETGNRSLLLRCLLDQAFCEEEIADEKALRLYERAIEVGQETSDLGPLSLAYSGAARITARAGDPSYAAHADEALRLARLAGSLRGEVGVHMSLASRAIMTGNAPEALRHSQRYLQTAEELGDPWIKACALCDVAFLRLQGGDASTAANEAEAALSFARGISNEYYTLCAAVVLAEARLDLRDAKGARDALAPALEGHARLWPGVLARGWRLLAAAREQLGDAPGAKEAAARARELDDGSPFSDPDRYARAPIRMPGGLNP